MSKDENMMGSGKWTPEGGSEGPLLLTNYAVTVNDEAVGAVGLDFGKGQSALYSAQMFSSVLTTRCVSL